MSVFLSTRLTRRFLSWQVLSAVLMAGGELEAQKMLESLAQLADISPLFFRTNVVSTARPFYSYI